ncbi:hypothetical protein B0A48_13577 [Cryoendolithus antarcticus]|uniref:Spherulation-specific family 4 n=1 Tax=Cryoendolithus antarcticus TaxID=1507870 RepID=A0A1V8SPA4_9PEZI|nr:hypothetical protein B0A48_13577 [Cryoendolithus antarcticus]
MGRFKQFLRIIANKNPAPESQGNTPRVTPDPSARPATPDTPSIQLPPRSGVIVPLYIYPLNAGTWEPLHKAIADHPDLQFIVVINPNSGPGKPPAPDESYAQELPKLNARPNVTTVGYVRTKYCKRTIDEVYEEVKVYAGWSEDGEQSGIFVQGVFMDEVPNHHSEHVENYLNDLTTKIKENPGILGKKLVIHNPGTIPDEALTNTRPDLTAVFEESYARYNACGPNEDNALAIYAREGCTYILHSVPKEKIRHVVKELRFRAEYLFVTSLKSHFYESFGESWPAFIEAMVEE